MPRGGGVRPSPVADLGGARGARSPPPGAQILSISCSFREKFDKIVCWRPPGELAPPPGEILDPSLLTPPPLDPPMDYPVYSWPDFFSNRSKSIQQNGLRIINRVMGVLSTRAVPKKVGYSYNRVFPYR